MPVVTRVPVDVGSKTQLDVALAVGSVSETITVAAEAPTLSTTSAATASSREESAATARQRRPIATPPVRRDFPETLYWQPALETDGLGRAHLRLKLADTITTWKVAVVVPPSAGSIALTGELSQIQPFFVENDPPPILTAGDAIGLPALVRNYTDDAVHVSVDGQATDGLRIAGAAGTKCASRRRRRRASASIPEPSGAAGKANVTLTARRQGQRRRGEVREGPPGWADTQQAEGVLLEGEAVLEPEHTRNTPS
jgi:uncharacterized protein YfaS (alpha-2-macroglobulin family)